MSITNAEVKRRIQIDIDRAEEVRAYMILDDFIAGAKSLMKYIDYLENKLIECRRLES